MKGSTHIHVLGRTDAEVEDGKTVDFRCSEHALLNRLKWKQDSSSMSIQSLTSTDPARRSNGTVYADIIRSRRIGPSEISYKHEPSQVIIIQIIEPGNKSVQPSVNVFTVNEAFQALKFLKSMQQRSFYGL